MITRSHMFIACSLAIFVGPVAAATSPSATPDDDGFVVVEAGNYTPPPPPPAPPAKVLKQWTVRANTPLRQVLTEWARSEGWQVYWPKADETTDLVSEVDVSFGAATFEDAVTRFANGLPPDVSIAVTFNRANNPKLLHVSESTRRQTIVADGSSEIR